MKIASKRRYIIVRKIKGLACSRDKGEILQVLESVLLNITQITPEKSARVYSHVITAKNAFAVHNTVGNELPTRCKNNLYRL